MKHSAVTICFKKCYCKIITILFDCLKAQFLSSSSTANVYKAAISADTQLMGIRGN